MNPPSVSAETHIRRNGQQSQRNLSKKAKNTPLGDRLLAAFKEVDGTEDKEVIAKILGYESKGAIYKIASGKMELKYSALINFKNYTKRSIDWLLLGPDADAVAKNVLLTGRPSSDKNPSQSIELSSPQFVIDVTPTPTGVRIAVKSATLSAEELLLDDQSLGVGGRGRPSTDEEIEEVVGTKPRRHGAR